MVVKKSDTKLVVDRLKKTFEVDEGINGPLNMVITRFDKMLGVRSIFEDEWDIDDAQFDAAIFEDPTTGQLMVNVNLEQSLIEMDLGRTSDKFVFDVRPAAGGGKPNVQQLESSKYVLQSFIDKENWWDQYRTWRQDKNRYGSAIWFCGLRFEVEYIPEIVKQELNEVIGDGFFSAKFIEKKVENYFFTPQNVPIRQFLIDDRYVYQNDFTKAEDCIMIETLSKEAFQGKYENMPNINKKALDAVPITEDNPAYGIPAPKGMIIIYHYYNRTTKDYIIAINRQYLLYEGKMMYKHGKLPFDVCQHYPNSACIYGISTCRKVRLSKAYKNNLMQSILDGSRLGSGKILAIGNSGENIDGDFQVTSGGINISRVTNSVDQIMPIDTRVDISGSVTAMSIIDQEVKQSTGLDLNSPFEVLDQEKLGQTEIREENKAIRQKAVDELMFQSLDRVLTMTLSNIAQLAPVLLRRITEVKDEEGNLVSKSVQRPEIQINNVTIKKENGSTVIEEDYGNYGYFELAPETIEGDMTVNITTPYTNSSIMQTIEKNKMQELVQNLQILSVVYGPQAVAEVAPMAKIWDKVKMAYGYDDVQFTADSKKDITTKKNEQMMKQINDMAYKGNPSLVNNPAPANGSSPQGQTPQGSPQPTGGVSQATLPVPAAPAGVPA